MCKREILYLVLIAILIMLVITSCKSHTSNISPYKTTSDNNQLVTNQNSGKQISVSQGNTSDLSATSSAKINKLEINNSDLENNSFEKVLNVVKTAINDMNWFNGGNSEFGGVEGKRFDIDVYINEKESIWVLFEKESVNQFMAASFSKSKYGYNNKPNSYFSRNKATKQEYIKTIENDGYKLLNKGELTFDNLSQPDYPQINDVREDTIKRISDLVPDTLKSFGLKGIYNVYIRNFRNNDSSTNVVIKGSSGKRWILDINLYDDGIVEKGKFYEVKNENLNYLATQYEKVTIKQIEVEIQ